MGRSGFLFFRAINMFTKKKISEEIKQAIFARIRPIIANQLGIREEAVLSTSNIQRDLGVDYDSLEAIELVMALEEGLNIEIPDIDAEKQKTIEDIIVYLAGRI